MNELAQHLENWLPIRISWRQTEPLIDWCYLGDRRFTEPFFDETIETRFRNPFNLFLRPLTNIGVLEQCHILRPGLKPSGFIFHLSRCGSTLVSQMLAALPRNIVISEASPLDWMIRAKIRRPDITDEAQIDWIRWMCSALGQKRWPEAQHYFIKLDAWHIFDLDLIERAYPDVPWIFLYRNPVEVMVSHKRQRGAVTFPGMMDHQLPGLSLTDAVLMPPDEYVARVLSSVCESALKHRDNRNGLFVNYNQLPQFVTSSLLQHFQVKYADDEIDCMNAASGFNAKNLSVEFTSDAKEKRSEASETIRQISDKMLMPLYEQLESVRYNSL